MLVHHFSFVCRPILLVVSLYCIWRHICLVISFGSKFVFKPLSRCKRVIWVICKSPDGLVRRFNLWCSTVYWCRNVFINRWKINLHVLIASNWCLLLLCGLLHLAEMSLKVIHRLLLEIHKVSIVSVIVRHLLNGLHHSLVDSIATNYIATHVSKNCNLLIWLF